MRLPTMIRRGVWTAVKVGAMLAAGSAARRLARGVWRRTAHHDPPPDREGTSVSFGRVLGWSVAAGTAVAVARVLGRRGAEEIWLRATGDTPPGEGSDGPA